MITSAVLHTKLCTVHWGLGSGFTWQQYKCLVWLWAEHSRHDHNVYQLTLNGQHTLLVVWGVCSSFCSSSNNFPTAHPLHIPRHLYAIGATTSVWGGWSWLWRWLIWCCWTKSWWAIRLHLCKMCVVSWCIDIFFTFFHLLNRSSNKYCSLSYFINNILSNDPAGFHIRRSKWHMQPIKMTYITNLTDCFEKSLDNTTSEIICASESCVHASGLALRRIAVPLLMRIGIPLLLVSSICSLVKRDLH